MRKLLEICLFVAALETGLFAGLLLTFWLAVDPMLAAGSTEVRQGAASLATSRWSTRLSGRARSS